MTKAVVGSFSDCVLAFAKIVARNPALAQKYGWPTEFAAQENWVDDRECGRLMAQGWTEFVEFGTGATINLPPLDTTEKKNWRSVAAAVVSGGKAAYSAYASMFGPGGKPIERALAEARAKVCVGCPQNDTAGGLTSYFLEGTASGIMALLGALKDLDVSTSVDDKLGVCKACTCPTRAKVWVNLDVIQKNMPAEVWPKLQRQPLCWILVEANRP